MSSFKHLFKSAGGIDVSGTYNEQTENWDFKFSQDVSALLDRNKAMYNENDGYSPSREWRRAASIPVIIQQKWLQEEGWDCYDLPANWDKLKQKLNSSEYLFLRTAPGRL
jgi:hypothetical protein